MATYNNVWFQSTNSTFVRAIATYSVVSSDAEYFFPSTLTRRRLPAISFITKPFTHKKVMDDARGWKASMSIVEILWSVMVLPGAKAAST